MLVFFKRARASWEIFCPHFCIGFLVIQLSVNPSFAIYMESPEYAAIPEAAKPLEGLLPKKGIESAHKQGYLQINSSFLKRKHNINFETRQVEVVSYLGLPPSAAQSAGSQVGGAQDSTPIWQAYYQELNNYSVDMNELALRRLWLNEFVGKEDAAQANGPGLLDIVLPVNVPDWMKRIGVDKPRLTINGSYKLIVEGSRISGNGSLYSGNSWFPDLHMDQQPAFSVKGSIGRLINIEINSEQGFGTNLKDQLKITYKGEGDELEDDIIQEIEAGNTSLALTGTSLTGYTEAHKGLFGLKMRLRFGGLEVTTIASQEGGTQNRQSLGAGLEQHDFTIEDRAMDLHRHFFLNLQDHRDYSNPNNWTGKPSIYANGGKGRGPVYAYQLLVTGEEPSITDTATACVYGFDKQKMDVVCERGRWKTLKAGEFFYDEDMRMLTVPNGNRSMSIAVKWQGDYVPRVNGITDSKNFILVHSRSVVGMPELDSLMWRNVYSIGKVNTADKQNFRVNLVKNSDSLSRDANDTISFLRKLGLEITDKPGQVNVAETRLFNFDVGYMVLPCLGGIGPTDDAQNCLTPMKRINPNSKIYEDNVDEVQNGPTTHKFVVSGKQRKSTFDVRETSHSVSGSQCVDIEKDTEILTLNGSTTLQENVDYEVLYETGQITLLSPRAKDPNAAIDISYECNPPFQIQDKILLGTRLEYKLDGISDESLLGATLLYKSQTTTAVQPELGREPFNQFLWGFNARLAGTPKWMTQAANLFPFVQTEAPSKANFEFEMAQSRYNPNTKDGAFLDNFESSENILTMPMTIRSWFKSSPPLYDNFGKLDETLDYKHQGDLIWHSSIKEVYSRIYGNTGNSYTDSREQTLLKLSLTPNDNLEGNSWGGVMRALSTSLVNQSKKRTLEVVVAGREGVLNVDLGQISEDISITGLNHAAPDGILESEIDLSKGETTNKDDAGLDGHKQILRNETGTRWECKPNCYPITLDSNIGDPGRDDYVEPVSDATEQTYHVNGTEHNNSGTQAFAYDTEDLDHSGVLDTKNTFLRYQILLDSVCSSTYHCETLRNGWRKYQIPLYGTGATIGAASGESEAQILSNAKILRVWLGKLPSHVTKSEVLLARVNLVGNAWEESQRNLDYQIDGDRFASGDLKDSLAIHLPPIVQDSNNLKVLVVNKQEEKAYLPSPNTPIERDAHTNEPLPERSLVLRYANLHPGEIVGATRLLGSDPKDLTLYSRLLMEIHPDSNAVINANTTKTDQNHVTLGLRLGKDQGDRDSKDYYEIRIHMDTLGQIDSKQVSLWNKNSFNISMADLTNLKNDSLFRAFNGRPVSRKIWNENRQDYSITLSIVGNPTLSRIDWMRLVIYVDSTATAPQKGDIWVDDLRLQGVDKSIGSSMRTQLQLDFADLINVSGNLTYTNGGFTSMSQTKATPANSQSTVDYNTNLTLFANKVFPDPWGVSMPMSLQYHGAITRPFTQPTSDLTLNGTDFSDIFEDIAHDHLSIKNYDDSLNDVNSRNSRVFQSTVFEQKLSASYKKDRRSSNYLIQTFLERPDLTYAYSASQSNNYSSSSDTRNYGTKLMYNLSPFTPKTYKPLSFLEKSKYVPSFLTSMDLSPLPDKVNLTVGELTFNRKYSVTKPRNAQDNPQLLPPVYTVELTHGLDMEWRLLTFFNYGYRIAVNRDFDPDHECFDETFFGQGDDHANDKSTCDAGFFAKDLVFGFDGSQHGPKHLGDQFGILDRERNRTQSFHLDVNPNIFSWLTMGANYNAGFRQTRADSVPGRFGGALTSPEHFEANTDHDIKLNSSLSLTGLLGPSGGGKGVFSQFKKKLEDWRLRNVDVSYSVSQKYNNDEYTYENLAKRTGSLGNYYAYQLGFVYDDPVNLVQTLFDGEPNATFMDYLSAPDPDLTGTRFSHGVNRSWDGSTGLTVPGIALSLSFNLKYSKEYTLYRAIQPSDTSVVWPDITVTGSFEDFSTKIPFLHKTFRSMTSTTTFNYRAEDKHSLFSQAQESQKTSYKFDPLMRLAATTIKDVRAELSLKVGLDQEIYYDKAADKAVPYLWYGSCHCATDTMLTTYPRIPEKNTPKDVVSMGADGSLGYDVETQKGLQFWRYYIKLENNLRLKVTSGITYTYTERILPGDKDPTRDQDILTVSAKPEASYNFTNNIDALFYTQYKYQKLFSTANQESTHEITVHGEFTMRF